MGGELTDLGLRSRALAVVALALIAATSAGLPQRGIEQNTIGVGYMNQYLYAEAAAAFRKALDADADLDLARVNLAIALFYKQEYEEAVRLLNAALAREPRSATAHYVLGLIAKNQGELESAAEHFRKVTELDGRDPPGLYNLGVTLARLGRAAEAEAALRRSLELDPANTSVLYNLGSSLVKSGKADEGTRLLDRFRALQQKGEGTSIGNQYGEAGTYALAMDVRPAPAPQRVAPKPADARAPFADRSAEAGLGKFAVAGVMPSSLRVGGTVALADLDGDGDVDAVVIGYNPVGGFRTLLLRNDGRGRFEDVAAEAGIVAGFARTAAIGDFDNDGLPDLYLSSGHAGRLLRNRGGLRFEDVPANAALRGAPATSATFVDFDHDGDLDLFLCQADSSGRMFRNNGKGSFTDVTQALGLASAGTLGSGMIATDLDNDRDIDLVVTHHNGPLEIFTNERNDRFREAGSVLGAAAAGEAHALTIADFDRDGAMDLLASTLRGGRRSVLLRNRGDGRLEEDTRSPELATGFPAGRFTTGALDFDLDGDLDLYVFGGEGGALFENAGDGRFVFAGLLPAPASLGGLAAASADFDADGRPDILYLDLAGSPRFLHNDVSTANHWLGVRLEGLRSNKSGFGAKIDVRAGALYQKLEISGHNGYLSQDSPTVWIGLGGATKADTISVRWPSGILQSEINAAADRVMTIKELDRKGTSCPLLYTWNGREFEFVTDFLGGCAIGYLEAPGQYSIPDTDEYVRIPGEKLAPRAGKYVLNLNNQLEEVILFDQARLLVVDHPARVEVYPNERLMPAPPFPEFRIHTAAAARPPRSAVDDAGRDVLPAVSALDRIYPDGLRSLPFKGYAETHTLTLDLGDVAHARKVLLLADAWIDYADSSSNLAASHDGLGQIPPYLEVRDKSGEWKTVVPSLGFPAGLPKTLTIDLSGKFLSGDGHVRIVTNMKIYWDRIRVDTSPDAPVRVTRLDATAADLHFRGYPAYYSPDGRLPWIYDYRRILPAETWGTHAGSYTRFGDVRPLLAARDDMFVITRHGDEITLEFDAAAAPTLAPGWTRDYLLYADGYGKDMDLNSLYPDVVGPLPFHAMSRFPYPATEHYPDDEVHRDYRRTYNTRVFPVRARRFAPTGP